MRFRVDLWLSLMIDGAATGKLVHLSGVDVAGSTAGSFARLLQDREMELWEAKRIVAHASDEEVSNMCSLIPY